ncbi:MAG: amidohydrolase family protein [Candidatus Eremiobacterota bacterium]
MDLSSVPALDSHCHPVLRPPFCDRLDYASAFSEAPEPAPDARHTLFFRRSLRDMGTLLDCEPTLEAVLQARSALGYDGLAQRCIEAAGVTELLMDDGLTPDRCWPLVWHEQFAGVRRLLRIERVAEDQFRSREDFSTFLERFQALLEVAEAAGFKTIAAYRTGLDVAPATRGDAESAYNAWGGGRLARKPLNDYLVHVALEVAAYRGLPVQFHTGFGDPDLELSRSNPLLLRPVIEAFPRVPLVLLHAGYPYAREAGFLASVYPNVHLDFGLAVPFLSVAGMRATLSMLIELAPLSRLTFSSDASRIPDLYYLGALWGRRALGRVLEDAVREGDLTATEAEMAARQILWENASQLYAGVES